MAAGWTETPSLIVTSPYVRAQQTAAATIARFPNVPVAIWPIEEFTYLEPSRWNGTRTNERLPAIERYWKQANPLYRDGPGAESFATLLGRAQATLTRLETFPQDALVLLFSHGQFIQAVRSLVTTPRHSERERMIRFWRKGAPEIANGETVAFVRHRASR